MAEKRNKGNSKTNCEFPKCGDTYTTQDDLANHIIEMHSDTLNIMKYKCTQCASITTYDSIEAVERHFKDNHKVGKKRQAKDTRAPVCLWENCYKEFSETYVLRRHVWEVHFGVREFRCNHCNKKSRDKSARDNHEAVCRKNPKHREVTEDTEAASNGSSSSSKHKEKAKNTEVRRNPSVKGARNKSVKKRRSSSRNSQSWKPSKDQGEGKSKRETQMQSPETTDDDNMASNEEVIRNRSVTRARNNSASKRRSSSGNSQSQKASKEQGEGKHTRETQEKSQQTTDADNMAASMGNNTSFAHPDYTDDGYEQADGVMIRHDGRTLNQVHWIDLPGSPVETELRHVHVNEGPGSADETVLHQLNKGQGSADNHTLLESLESSAPSRSTNDSPSSGLLEPIFEEEQ